MADLIDRQALIRDIEKYHLSDGMFQHWVEVQPSVEAEPVVRCKDCKHGSPNGKYGCRVYHYRRYETHDMKPDDFCSRGEMKSDGRLN